MGLGMLDFAFEWLFGALYGGFIIVAALLAAIPYAIWQGLKRIGARFKGDHQDGHTRTGR
jgi:hypothetical protein